MFICWMWAAAPHQDVSWVEFPGAHFSGHLQESAGADDVYAKQTQKGYCNLPLLPIPASNKSRREVKFASVAW